MEFADKTAEPYTVLHLSALNRIGSKMADLGRGYSVQRTSMGVVVQHFSIRLGEYVYEYETPCYAKLHTVIGKLLTSPILK